MTSDNLCRKKELLQEMCHKEVSFLGKKSGAKYLEKVGLCNLKLSQRILSLLTKSFDPTLNPKK